jgi:hypothetical protein
MCVRKAAKSDHWLRLPVRLHGTNLHPLAGIFTKIYICREYSGLVKIGQKKVLYMMTNVHLTTLVTSVTRADVDSNR